MAILPTAHATQRFGSRAIDFYVAPGQVIGSDPRARADERRIQDLDGERHPVRVGKRDFALDAGDYAAVIRLQPGPKRRSRPVAVVNYRTGTWTRTSQDNTSLLSRAGVSRNANWLLTVMAMAALALLVAWPQLLVLLGLLMPGLAAGLPAFDVFSALVNVQPGLADARLADTAPGLAETISTLSPNLSGFEGVVMFAAIVALGAFVAFAARSWRFAWVPVFLVLMLAAAIAVNGPQAAGIPALLALSGSVLLFIVAGAVNRWRDAMRLEARIARLADHVLRHPPQEMVTRRETAAALDTGDADGSGDTDALRATPVIATLGTATISARSGEGDSDPSGGEPVARSASAKTEVPETDAPETGMPESAPDAGSEAAGAATSDADLPAADAGAGEAGPDARSEARSMDIPPPPPMPLEAAASGGDAGRVNRDAETGEVAAGTSAVPVVTQTETLRPEQPLETAGLAQPAPAPEDHADSGPAPAEDALEAGDAYGSGESPEPHRG